MKMKPIYNKLETVFIQRGSVIDWIDIREAISMEINQKTGEKTLDKYTQALVNRLHKSAPHLLAR